ncbi:hypothetical protein LY78DRAFT_60955 [Colletotrichum sublineola]|nr:hypothetical protein LY78DRAFT_60955 [Colletotrichum sublineola]
MFRMRKVVESSGRKLEGLSPPVISFFLLHLLLIALFKASFNSKAQCQETAGWASLTWTSPFALPTAKLDMPNYDHDCGLPFFHFGSIRWVHVLVPRAGRQKKKKDYPSRGGLGRYIARRFLTQWNTRNEAEGEGKGDLSEDVCSRLGWRRRWDPGLGPNG